MKLIIGDIGNTTSKIYLVSKKSYKIIKVFSIETKKIISTNYIKKIFKGKSIKNKNLLKKALFASVVPSKYLIFKKFLSKYYNIRSYEIKDKKIKNIIRINIKKPKQVGSDRIANATGASKMFNSNCIIIDFGTATTFDVVKKGGIYIGGLIAPGIELSLKNLYTSTAKLPLVKVKKTEKIIGKNTQEAMHSGFFWGYLGLVKSIIFGIKKETKSKYKLICTGGLSTLFSRAISSKCTVSKYITLKGIVEIYKKNERNL